MSKNRKNGNRKRLGGFRGNKRTVLILTPCDDSVKTPFHVSLINMLLYTVTNPPRNFGGVQVQAFGSSILPASREKLARFAIERNPTHTLWIDSDMAFSADMLVRFLAHPEPIVGINASTRRPTFRNTAQVTRGVELETSAESTGTVEVYRMGFGVVWIRTEVFKEMEPPRFDVTYLPDEADWRGEDYVFFEKARASGYKFYVDQDISKSVQHYGAFGYSPMMVEDLRRAAKPVEEKAQTVDA